jgi:hypothetical protein
MEVWVYNSERAEIVLYTHRRVGPDSVLLRSGSLLRRSYIRLTGAQPYKREFAARGYVVTRFE